MKEDEEGYKIQDIFKLETSWELSRIMGISLEYCPRQGFDTYPSIIFIELIPFGVMGGWSLSRLTVVSLEQVANQSQGHIKRKTIIYIHTRNLGSPINLRIFFGL